MNFTFKYRVLDRWSLTILCFLIYAVYSYGQTGSDRFTNIETKLKELSSTNKGLNEKVEMSVSGISVQEFISGLATTNNLNISVDNNLNTPIINNFSNVTVAEVLLFLCKKYELDMNFIGNIMSVTKFIAPVVEQPKPKAKQIKLNYDKNTDILTLDLSNDSLTAVAKEITKISGKNMVVVPELNNKMVSGYIQALPLKNALDNLAFANDLKITSTPDNSVFYIEKNVPEGQASSTNKPKNNRNNNNQNTSLPQGVNFKSENGLISVEANNTPITDVVSGISGQLGIDYFLFSEIKGNATLKATDIKFDDFLTLVLNGTDYTYKKQDSIYLIGDRNLEGLRNTRIVELKYRSADKISDIIPADLKKGVDIKPFPDLNGVILSGSQPRIEEIEAFLRKIDRVVPVVVIEILIVDISDSKTISTGITAGLSDEVKKTGGSLFPGVDLTLSTSSINNLIDGINGFGAVNLGYVTPKFYLTIKAMEKQGILKLRSTPKIATLNGHDAKMSIGKTEYYLETTTTLIGGVNNGSQQAINYKPVNADLSISINPVISADEQITLDIKMKQSSFTARISPTAPPGTQTRDFQSFIRVKNDEMIMLGGLEEESRNETADGVPVLSRIPVIKWLFSSRTREAKKAKLAIFIKPSVIY